MVNKIQKLRLKVYTDISNEPRSTIMIDDCSPRTPNSNILKRFSSKDRRMSHQQSTYAISSSKISQIIAKCFVSIC